MAPHKITKKELKALIRSMNVFDAQHKEAYLKLIDTTNTEHLPELAAIFTKAHASLGQLELEHEEIMIELHKKKIEAIKTFKRTRLPKYFKKQESLELTSEKQDAEDLLKDL